MLEEEQRQEVDHAYQQLLDRMAGLLKEGIESGEFRPCDVTVAASTMLSVMLWYPFLNLWPDGSSEVSRGTFREFIKALILQGAAADRSAIPPYQEIEFKGAEGSAAQPFDHSWITDVKREAILSVASRLFNEKGIDATTLEEIASQIGATTGALYHQIGGRETIVTECYFRSAQIGLLIFDRAAEQPGSRLAALAAAQQAWSQAQMLRDLASLRPIAGFDAIRPQSRQRFAELVDQVGGRWLKLVGSARGEFRDMDLNILKRSLPGLSSWVARIEPAGLEQQRAIAREMAMFLMIGIGALPGAETDSV